MRTCSVMVANDAQQAMQRGADRPRIAFPWHGRNRRNWHEMTGGVAPEGAILKAHGSP
jgi:hypothetical protein